jgi:type I restriction enzyme R subunit
MKSQNFEFLRASRAVLADLAGFAERYAHEDPASSLIKQRSFVEHVVTAIYERYRLRPPFSDNLNDLMNAEPFRQSAAHGVPRRRRRLPRQVRHVGGMDAPQARPFGIRLNGAIANQSQQHEHSGPAQAIHIK